MTLVSQLCLHCVAPVTPLYFTLLLVPLSPDCLHPASWIPAFRSPLWPALQSPGPFAHARRTCSPQQGMVQRLPIECRINDRQTLLVSVLLISLTGTREEQEVLPSSHHPSSPPPPPLICTMDAAGDGDGGPSVPQASLNDRRPVWSNLHLLSFRLCPQFVSSSFFPPFDAAAAARPVICLQSNR